MVECLEGLRIRSSGVIGVVGLVLAAHTFRWEQWRHL
jgi:hypothetical protein